MARPLGRGPLGDLVECLRGSLDWMCQRSIRYSYKFLGYRCKSMAFRGISLHLGLAPVTFHSFKGPRAQRKLSHAAMAFLCRCDAAIREAALEDQDAGIQQERRLATLGRWALGA